MGGLILVIISILFQHTVTIYFICGLNCSDLCFTREQKQPWWSASLHAVHHFHLTTTEAAKHKIEIETVKGERKRHLQPEGVEKEPQSSIMIKGYCLSQRVLKVIQKLNL